MSIDTTPPPTEVFESGRLTDDAVSVEQAEPEQLLKSTEETLGEQPRWPRLHKLGRYLGKTAAAAVIAAGAGVIAVEAAPPAHVDLAGQDATIEPVIGKNYTTIDGILNRQDHAGAYGVVAGANVNANLLRLLFPQNDQDRAAATQLVQDPIPEIDRLQKAARNQALLYGGTSTALAMLVEAGFVITRQQQRRKFNAGSPEYQRHVSDHNRSRNRRETALAGLAVTAVLGTSGYILATPDHHDVQPSAIFNGTPFAGTEEISGAADRIGPMIRARYSPEQAAFYDKVSANLADVAANTPGLAERQAGTTRLLLGDDIQFVQGMARAFGTSAKVFNVDGTFYLGDWTDTDSDIESFILDTFLYYSDGRDMLSMAGLHDTDTIIEAEAARDNITLAENKMVHYKDLDVLALNDPRVSTLNRLGMLYGTPYSLRDPNVTIDDFVTRAVDKICNDQPRFMALHDNKLGKLILTGAEERGCETPITFDGRSYTPLGLQEHNSLTGDNNVLEYTTGSAGGHRDTSFSTGIIQNAAFEAVVDIDTTSNTVTIYPITINPDSTVTVAEPIVRGLQQTEALPDDNPHPQHVNALVTSKR